MDKQTSQLLAVRREVADHAATIPQPLHLVLALQAQSSLQNFTSRGLQMERYAIIDGSDVINVIDYDAPPSNPPPGFDVPIIAVQSDVASPGWTYVDGVFIAPPVPPLTDSELIAQCQSQAVLLLASTDWSEIASVTNTANNPYLINAAEFVTYRCAVRVYAVTPVTDPIWPVCPTADWS